ncbi:MAG TPA: hypothetical protein DEA97_10950 [Bacteroidales bacterium]|nr:hypothetical protein [Bacteroidales bacterium]
MKKTGLFIFIAFLSFFLFSCHTGKMLEKPTTIMVVENELYLDKKSTGSNKYIDNYTKEEYRDKMLVSLKDAFLNCNLVITDSPEKAEYTVVIDKYLIEESSVTETVNDQASPYNGMSYVLSTCDVQADYRIFIGAVSQQKMLEKTSVSADKDEKVTNNRNLGDYIVGSNKDNSSYRQKELFDDVFLTLSDKCGRRISADISKRLYKYLKKGK